MLEACGQHARHDFRAEKSREKLNISCVMNAPEVIKQIEKSKVQKNVCKQSIAAIPKMLGKRKNQFNVCEIYAHAGSTDRK